MGKKEVPVFVKIDEYKDVLDILTLAKEKLELAKNSLAKVKELNDRRGREIEGWENIIKNAEDRIDDVDHTLLEPEMP